jgi:ribonuclease D
LELGAFEEFLHTKRERRARRRDHQLDLVLRLERIVEDRVHAPREPDGGLAGKVPSST